MFLRCKILSTRVTVQPEPYICAPSRLCKNFEMAQCDNPNCPFAHGGEELRGTDGVWKTVILMPQNFYHNFGATFPEC